jgi:hypothetical protein
LIWPSRPVKTLDFNRVIEGMSKGWDSGSHWKMHAFSVLLIDLLYAAHICSPNVFMNLQLQAHGQTIIQNPSREIHSGHIVMRG